MKLIGMLDSPYVRRVAISLQLLGLRFEHQSLSVFSTFAAFRQINPVVKAPTFLCDDGEVLMDSTLILEYAEALAHPRTLMPSGVKELQHDLRLIPPRSKCAKSGFKRGRNVEANRSCCNVKSNINHKLQIAIFREGD